MNNEELLLKRRFIELCRRAQSAAYFSFSDFLGLGEMTIFNTAAEEVGNVPYMLYGGHPDSERKVVRFGNEEELGYSEPFPIKILKLAPKSQKFADMLTHRDCLGALMNLGIERAKLGDISIHDNIGYLFVKEEMAEYICQSLTKIKHTDILVSEANELPEGELYRTRAIRVQSSSERADSIVAKVFSLSRDDSQMLFRKGLVFIDGKMCESASKVLRMRQVVSVRGHGRFIYRGYESLSKKGKFNIDVLLYI